MSYCVCACECVRVSSYTYQKLCEDKSIGQAHIPWCPIQPVLQCLNCNHFTTNISDTEIA